MKPFFDVSPLAGFLEKDFVEVMQIPFYGNAHHFKEFPTSVTSFKFVTPTADDLIPVTEEEADKLNGWEEIRWIVVWRDREIPSDKEIFVEILNEILEQQ